MTTASSRRDFIVKLGVSAAAANFAFALPSLGWAASATKKKRLVFVFTPNGVIPDHFWPDEEGTHGDLKRILAPLDPFKQQMLTLEGVDNKIKGDGDGHMRGIGCLLTGVELFPGDVQGGSDTPAGWSMGISVDQHIRNKLQADAQTRTRFGSLEFGVMVPQRADTWTRWSYAGPNQPVAPVSDPYQMFNKLYGQTQNRAMLASVLDDLREDFKSIEKMVSAEDRQMLLQHVDMVRSVEKELKSELAHQSKEKEAGHSIPKLPPNIEEENDNMPTIARMQSDLLVNSFAADFARVASVQITNSVGNARMRWLDINEGHHAISHEPDSNESAYENLIRINTWYCEQIAYLAKRLADTPEPGGDGSLLDNTTIVWTNELGKGNSHTRNSIPFVMVGGGLGMKMGRAMKFDHVPHNRLLLSLTEAMGYPEKSFGNPDYCGDGSLTGLNG
ncbi:hypothetical protein K227x_24700 [Rubripirellula lacrimiformis]|uniref:Secreted protein containing DUF1552 n=1 Tax=Rubripirellula lacrimiformis TaxID=1930273 RepID=A0A517NAC3_9BACT|nr:DUF1552 domain-containing protein [Rubripirellula lacrimiformis]QDT04082.1 hypothetical protein K227x_24700 [Rubripirellula lacrimiformis]